jgi:hypothetical protein
VEEESFMVIKYCICTNVMTTTNSFKYIFAKGNLVLSIHNNHDDEWREGGNWIG